MYSRSTSQLFHPKAAQKKIPPFWIWIDLGINCLAPNTMKLLHNHVRIPILKCLKLNPSQMYCSYEYYVSYCNSCWSVTEASLVETAVLFHYSHIISNHVHCDPNFWLGFSFHRGDMPEDLWPALSLYSIHRFPGTYKDDNTPFIHAPALSFSTNSNICPPQGLKEIIKGYHFAMKLG